MWNTKGGLAAAIIAGLLAAGTAPDALAEPLSGPVIAPDRTRPAWPRAHPALCSDRQPLCVHARASKQAVLLAPVLADLEQVAFRAGRVLRWPAPMPDRSRRGSGAFDVYLEKPADRSHEVTADVPMELDFVDRASAFALIDPELPAGCVRRSLLAEAWARAGLYGVDAGANDALASSAAAWLAWLVDPCEATVLGAIDDYQANPQRAVSNETHARGSMLFPWFIQTQYGAPDSVDLLHALWLLSQQRTPPDNFRWINRPDFIDVLRSMQKDRGATLGDLLLEYSTARAFVGDRDDGMHMPDSTWLGRAGRVRFDARVDYGSLPQWVRPAAPIEPSGATYIWISLKGAPKNASLGFRAEWETPTAFRFAFLKIGADGTEMSRLAPVTQEKATQIEVNVEDFSGAEALLIVGANVGAMSGEFKYDPDEMPLEPQGYLITLVAQH